VLTESVQHVEQFNTWYSLEILPIDFAMNPKSNRTDSNWQPCAKGAIGSASDLARSRSDVIARRQFLKSASAAAVVVAGAGFAGWSLLGQKDELGALRGNPNYPGGIACSEVKRLLPKYIVNVLPDQELVESISVHLAACSHCRDHRDALTKTA
jgi:hypothetical protein